MSSYGIHTVPASSNQDVKVCSNFGTSPFACFFAVAYRSVHKMSDFVPWTGGRYRLGGEGEMSVRQQPPSPSVWSVATELTSPDEQIVGHTHDNVDRFFSLGPPAGPAMPLGLIAEPLRRILAPLLADDLANMILLARSWMDQIKDMDMALYNRVDRCIVALIHVTSLREGARSSIGSGEFEMHLREASQEWGILKDAVGQLVTSHPIRPGPFAPSASPEVSEPEEFAALFRTKKATQKKPAQKRRRPKTAAKTAKQKADKAVAEAAKKKAEKAAVAEEAKTKS